ncbi:hypothetical protein [Citrobacter europaeus]|uniref:hypothetical protein n=1 Tax=Citrobacter europaeus TaxID=1914243 RepID=UPI0012D36AAE|nr:hypothetical protein [Citrobacter europaeus]
MLKPGMCAITTWMQYQSHPQEMQVQLSRQFEWLHYERSPALPYSSEPDDKA